MLRCLSEALNTEPAPLVVHVIVVEPGYFRTDFLDSSSLHVQQQQLEDYLDGPAGSMRETAARVNHAQPGDCSWALTRSAPSKRRSVESSPSW